MSKICSKEDLTNIIETYDDCSVIKPDIDKIIDAITYLSAIVNESEKRIANLEEQNTKLIKEIKNRNKDISNYSDH